MQRMLSIMLEILKAFATQSISHGKEIVDGVIAKKCRDRGIEISAMENSDHECDQIIDIDQHI